MHLQLCSKKSPHSLRQKLQGQSKIPTIGIGAGPHCDGQILVYADMVGLTRDFKPRFVRHYANIAEEMHKAFVRYIEDVKNGKFPSKEESY